MRPIIIVTIPNSGSSLITGIFAAHGVYVGEYSKKREGTKDQYDSYENIQLTRLICKRMPFDVNKVMPTDKRWMYKGSPHNALFLKSMVSDAQLIKVTRKWENILKSSGEIALKTRKIQREQMENIMAPTVDVDAVICGNYITLEYAFDRCGMTFITDLAEKQINRQLWHHQ